jgi:hypothetical protein
VSEQQWQPFQKGILLKAANDNTSPIYIGSENVSGISGGRVGMPLDPGQSTVFPCDSPHSLWAVSDDMDQILHWLGG